MNKRRMMTGLVLICLIGLVTLLLPMPVKADGKQQFRGEVVMLKQEQTTALFQITVSNDGDDFDGTVRFQIVDASDRTNTALDTQLTLPQGSEKQYTINVGVADLADSRGAGYLSFVDKKGHLLQQIKLSDLLGDHVAKISLGILSDHFDELKCMQMPGMYYYVQDTEWEIALVEMSPAELEEQIKGLTFLVIDQYDMSRLNSEQMKAIENWVDQGGWLILGTGAMGQSMLSAFSNGFLDLSYVGTTQPGEPNEISQITDKNQGDYDAYTTCGIDFKQMAYSEFTSVGGTAYFSSENPGWSCQCGQGSVLVLGVSLTDLQLQKYGNSICYTIYDEVQYNSVKGTSYDAYDSWDYLGVRGLNIIDQQFSNVNFTSLKVLIFLYAILVGPILYLILRKAKKSEWYWIGIPVLGLVFVGLVFVCGNGMQVRDTRTYSVSAQQADASDHPKVDTYLMGYHSGVKEWSVKLKENYQYAGSAFAQYRSTHCIVPEYENHIVYRDGEIAIGAKPSDNFENEYFVAGGTGVSVGTIDAQQIASDNLSMSGTVTNNTTYDFAYLSVLCNDAFILLKDIKSGETVDIADYVKNNRYVYMQTSDVYVSDLLDQMVDFYGIRRSSNTVEEKDRLAALFIGMCDARQNAVQDMNQAVITGVVADKEQSATQNKGEHAYNCFYTYAKQEDTNVTN